MCELLTSSLLLIHKLSLRPPAKPAQHALLPWARQRDLEESEGSIFAAVANAVRETTTARALDSSVPLWATKRQAAEKGAELCAGARIGCPSPRSPRGDPTEDPEGGGSSTPSSGGLGGIGNALLDAVEQEQEQEEGRAQQERVRSNTVTAMSAAAKQSLLMRLPKFATTRTAVELLGCAACCPALSCPALCPPVPLVRPALHPCAAC